MNPNDKPDTFVETLQNTAILIVRVRRVLAHKVYSISLEMPQTVSTTKELDKLNRQMNVFYTAWSVLQLMIAAEKEEPK